MKIIDTTALNADELRKLVARPPFDQIVLPPHIQANIRTVFGQELDARQVVEKIIADVRANGDAAVLHYTQAIDGVELTAAALEVDPAEITAARKSADAATVAALERAIDNVRRFHAEQLPRTWLTEREYGSLLGQKVTPLDRVGLYVPGGTAAYPSSVIMNALPAQVAGVKELIMCVPPGPRGQINPYVLIAAQKTGVQKIFKVGGAQAVAALAFGTATIPRVDKITGPGNIFVTLAKKAVYGHCDIDMLAGPSEILIIADSSVPPDWLAADLLSQAEHDPLAAASLVTDSRELAAQVAAAVADQLELLPRREIARQALAGQGRVFIVRDLAAAADLSNLVAPEHLQVATRQPFALLPLLRHAGAIFLGPHSPEPLGDYFAGPNHVLPTGGTARFYSALNVETFMKKTSIIAYSEEALAAAAEDVTRLARAEGLDAHANALQIRLAPPSAENKKGTDHA